MPLATCMKNMFSLRSLRCLKFWLNFTKQGQNLRPPTTTTLEKHCGVQAIDPGNAREVSTFGEASKRPKDVLHVHGCYNKASGAVLDVLDYNQITGDHRMQDTLRGLLLNKTVLFIGTGAGLQDPNFSNLLEWTDKHFSGDVEKRHYVLFRNKDLTHYSALNSIPYGEDYKNLIPFLRVLAEDVPRAHQRQYGNW
jgi:hypothetical protein